MARVLIRRDQDTHTQRDAREDRGGGVCRPRREAPKEPMLPAWRSGSRAGAERTNSRRSYPVCGCRGARSEGIHLPLTFLSCIPRPRSHRPTGRSRGVPWAGPPPWAAGGGASGPQKFVQTRDEHNMEQPRSRNVGGHSCHSKGFWDLSGVFKTAKRSLLRSALPGGPARMAELPGLSDDAWDPLIVPSDGTRAPLPGLRGLGSAFFLFIV